MGVAPDGLRMFEHLSGRELLAYTGALRRMEPRVVEERTDELLDVLELSADQDVVVADYSAGMKKKIAWPALSCTPPRCSCSTSRSSRSTRCPAGSSAASCARSSPGVARS